ncbi:MAG: metallophosphoesterase [Archangium sp.]|nr:metallophosphoesterase [Archangium sp.]MDP3576110.1 metallophosphoesterase [Archangium sp.]
MKFHVLHLSDIHMKASGNFVGDKGKVVVRAISQQHSTISHLLVLISGDIANWGLKEEYEAFARVIKDIKSELEVAFPGASIHLRMVPGNHDCNFSTENAVRTALITPMLDSDTVEGAAASIVDICASVQADFWTCESKTSGTAESNQRRIGYVDEITIEDKRIEILGLNSAWLSLKREQQGRLAVPAAMLSPPQTNPDFRIAMIHHPANWQAPGAARSFRDYILRSVDILLVGHEHMADITTTSDPSGNAVVVVDAPAFQSAGNDSSGFAMLRVDGANRELIHQVYKWKGTTRAYEALEPETSKLERIGAAAHSPKKPKPAFVEFLSSPDINFSHPRASDLRVEDLFVWPDFSFQHLDRVEKGPSLELGGEPARERLLAQKHLLIDGAERSGRTAIAKMLAQALLATGHTVVWIEGATINCFDVAELMSKFEQAYRATYGGESLSAILQNTPESAVLIIDNLDLANVDKAKFGHLLNNSGKLFGKVIALVSDLFPAVEIVLGNAEARDGLLHYQRATIRDLGRRAKRELVEKWYSIGADLLSGEDEYENLVASAETYVNGHVGRGIFPSQPICVLTLIQAHTLATNTDLSAGAYGAIFEVLLQASLARNSRRVPAEFLQAILAEIAIYMFVGGIREMTEDEFLALTSAFNASRLTDFSQEHIREALLDARLLRLRDGRLVFRYPHMYYLSCAKALQIQKQDPELRAQADEAIDQLISTIDRDESANILVCYLYFSKDLGAVQKAITATNAVFADEALADPLTLDFGLASAWPQNILEDVNLDEKRLRRFRESQDQVEQAQEDVRKAAEAGTAEATVVLNAYFKCVKSMHVIGQVVRSFPALLPGSVKIQAIESVVGVALRTLSQYSTVMRVTKDDLSTTAVRGPRA